MSAGCTSNFSCAKVMGMSTSHFVRTLLSGMAKAEIAAYGIVALLAFLLLKAG